MPISDFLSSIFTQGIQDNPDFKSMPGYDRNQIGRLALQKLVGSLQTGQTAFGGLANGIAQGQNLYSDELDKWVAEEAKKKQQDATYEQTKQATLNAAQENDLRNKEESRKEESFPLEQQARGQNIDIQASKEGREQDQWDATQANQAQQQTGSLAAIAFGKTPQQQAYLKALANAGQYDTMWKALTAEYVPPPKDPKVGAQSWSDPYLKPGVGLVQRNNQTNSLRILAHDPNEDGSRFRASPIALGKMKTQILEKELIPAWKRSQDAAQPGILSKISAGVNALSGGHLGSPIPADNTPMSSYGLDQIPSSLIDQADRLAEKRYVDAYRNAVNDFRGGPAPKPRSSIGSVSSGPVKGKPLQEFSSQLALEKAVRDNVYNSPQYSAMDPGTKEQYVERIISQVKDQVANGQGTLEDAIRQFNSPDPSRVYTPAQPLQPTSQQEQ